MSKLTDAKEILNALQVPTKQQNGMPLWGLWSCRSSRL